MTSEWEIALPPLHPRQREIADNPARFKVVSAGRRFGKTRLGVVLCIATALQNKCAWWVAPSFPIAQIGWKEIKRLAKQIPGANVKESERIAELPTGGWVGVKSADNPDSLRGEGLDFVCIDECAFVKEEAWVEALRPALSDRKGEALFISTPKGRNWFYTIYQRGLQGGEWNSWQIHTSENPIIDKDEIEAARVSLPEAVFLQEYMAEFLDDAGMVFRKVMAAAIATWQDKPPEVSKGNEFGEGAGEPHKYVFGVDWGKSNDWTVVMVLDLLTHEVVNYDRFNQIDYHVQRQRLEALYKVFKPDIIIAERNAMGDPIIEELQRSGMPVQPFTTTQASKIKAIEDLSLAFEQGDIKIPNDQILISELQSYAGERLPSGLMRYNAPDGMHDDCVMALALAWQGCAKETIMVANPFYD